MSSAAITFVHATHKSSQKAPCIKVVRYGSLDGFNQVEANMKLRSVLWSLVLARIIGLVPIKSTNKGANDEGYVRMKHLPNATCT